MYSEIAPLEMWKVFFPTCMLQITNGLASAFMFQKSYQQEGLFLIGHNRIVKHAMWIPNMPCCVCAWSKLRSSFCFIYRVGTVVWQNFQNEPRCLFSACSLKWNNLIEPAFTCNDKYHFKTTSSAKNRLTMAFYTNLADFAAVCTNQMQQNIPVSSC